MGRDVSKQRVSAGMVAAMKLVTTGKATPYQAAQKAGIALSTMYRSPLYKNWRDSVKPRTDK